MTYEQLLEQIRAGHLNFVVYRNQRTERIQLVPYYHVLYTKTQHDQILDVLRDRKELLAAAIMLNRVDVCIDQSGHATHHYYVGDVLQPHTRCRECERIRNALRPKNEEEWLAHTVTIVQEG